MDFDKLYSECIGCTKCALCETRNNVVFGVGDRNADVMFVGEGPGEHEDLSGEPFVGRAGKLLDDMMEIIYLNRKNTFIANIVKCRPPQNRDPLGVEQEACYPWLARQIELIAPKIIVCLGRIAAMRMIRADFKITREHGEWFDIDGIRYMAIFHPAALLRDPRRRPETFEDLKVLQAEIQATCNTYE